MRVVRQGWAVDAAEWVRPPSMGMDLEAGADGSGIQDGKSAEGLRVLAGWVAMVDRRHERVETGGAAREKSGQADRERAGTQTVRDCE